MTVPGQILTTGMVARRYTCKQLFVLELEMQRQPRAPADKFLLHPRRITAAVFGQHVRVGGQKRPSRLRPSSDQPMEPRSIALEF